MTITAAQIYQDIALRTGGDIYIGVVGPVRTGKSTFIKRFMETLVIPNMENVYRRERAKDELPQSGSGRTIMTAEPKFIPEDAVEISPDGSTSLSIRLIDSVGYLIPGAIGAEEDGNPRMVTTPWFPQEIPMAEAAELGTKKIMEEHCTIGIVITSDGSATDIPREEYLEAESRAIEDMKRTGKPFLVLINSTDPCGTEAQQVRQHLEEIHRIRCLCVDCLTLQEQELTKILNALLYEFPVSEIQFYMPRWVDALPVDHGIKASVYAAMRKSSQRIATLSEAEPTLSHLADLEAVESFLLRSVDPSTGTVVCELTFPETLFYQVLSEHSGFSLENDGDLLHLLKDLAVIRGEYEKVSSALEQVKATGYGIVMPTQAEMHLEEPQIVKKGSNYSVRMTANASSIHMIRADVETEICPIVGDEKQAADLVQYLMNDYDGDIDKLWSSNIFGRTVSDLINDGIGSKLRRMPEASRQKLQSTLSRIINEESSGLICIILA